VRLWLVVVAGSWRNAARDALGTAARERLTK